MDPSVGRFISMDEYQGSIFDPVSLHKYLYANANPVMYTDPTGYFSLGEMSAASTVRGVINGIATGGISGATLNSLIAFAQGEEITTKVVWDGFWQGAIFGGSLGGLGKLAQTFMTARLAQSAVYSGFAIDSSYEAMVQFQNNNPLLGMIFLADAMTGGKGKAKTNVGQTSKASNVKPVDKMSHVREAGKIGERAAGIPKNTERIPSATGKKEYRIPDGLDGNSKTLIEVKNVKTQSYTSQIKDFHLWSRKYGYDFVLMTRNDTKITGPLQQLIDSGDIVHRYINL